MENTFFKEIARRLKAMGIETALPENRTLPVLISGQTVILIGQNSNVVLTPIGAKSQEVKELYHKIRRLSASVKEYTDAMERPIRLRAVGLNPADNFRLLADFNGVVLAGKELENDWGYEFVTWERSFDHSGLGDGNYYADDYEAAKEGFAIRSRMIERNRIFTIEQLSALSHCLNHYLIDSPAPTIKEDSILAQIERQTAYAVEEEITEQSPDEPQLNM